MKKTIAILLTLMLLCLSCLTAALAEDTVTVSCPEMGFSTKAPAGAASAYTEGTGFQIFVESEGYIPYLIITRRTGNMKFNNPVNYLNNVLREYQEEKYGDDCLGMNPAKTWEFGGKELTGARYMYKVGDYTVCMLVVIEVRDDGDVEYTAKYLQDNDAATLAALDTAVRYYQAEGTPAPADAVAPIAAGSVNTEDGLYWAEVTDLDKLESGGYFSVSLYSRDLYPVSSINALQPGDKLQVAGSVFTVKTISALQDGGCEVVPEESFDGYIVFRAWDEDPAYCTALVNDWEPATFLETRKIMMPLPNDFSFVYLSGGEDATVYDADGFVHLMIRTENPPVLSRYNTALQFSGGLVMGIMHRDYPVGPQE